MKSKCVKNYKKGVKNCKNRECLQVTVQISNKNKTNLAKSRKTVIQMSQVQSYFSFSLSFVPLKIIRYYSVQCKAKLFFSKHALVQFCRISRNVVK